MAAQRLGTRIRKEQIAQAAARIIAEKGVKELNIATIAAEAGIVPSAVYRHFESKEEIIDAVLDQFRDRVLANMQIASGVGAGPVAQLKKFVFLQLGLIQENSSLPRILFSEDVFSGSEMRRARVHEIATKVLAMLGRIISQGQARGEIRKDAAPETLALMLLGIIQPAIFLWHLSGGEFDVRRHSRKAWRAYEKYLTAGIR